MEINPLSNNNEIISKLSHTNKQRASLRLVTRLSNLKKDPINYAEKNISHDDLSELDGNNNKTKNNFLTGRKRRKTKNISNYMYDHSNIKYINANYNQDISQDISENISQDSFENRIDGTNVYNASIGLESKGRGKCKYSTGKCNKERAIKSNGKILTLCEYHRILACRNQRKTDSKRRDKKYQKNSLYHNNMIKRHNLSNAKVSSSYSTPVNNKLNIRKNNLNTNSNYPIKKEPICNYTKQQEIKIPMIESNKNNFQRKSNQYYGYNVGKECSDKSLFTERNKCYNSNKNIVTVHYQEKQEEENVKNEYEEKDKIRIKSEIDFQDNLTINTCNPGYDFLMKQELALLDASYRKEKEKYHNEPTEMKPCDELSQGFFEIDKEFLDSISELDDFFTGEIYDDKINNHKDKNDSRNFYIKDYNDSTYLTDTSETNFIENILGISF